MLARARTGGEAGERHSQSANGLPQQPPVVGRPGALGSLSFRLPSDLYLVPKVVIMSSSDQENEEPAAPRRSSRNDDHPVKSKAKPAVVPVILAKPTLHGRRNWDRKNLDGFSSVDGNKIGCRWDRRATLSWTASGILEKGEKALVAKHDKHDSDVALELTKFGGYGPKLSQVPYHADMLPAYDYFAQGVSQHSQLDSFKVSNFHLPPSPWLGDTLLPILQTHSSGYDFDENLASLTLSNCSLSGDDLKSLAKFLKKNTTLRTLDLSQTNIESVATVKAIAKAIKSNPSLLHVRLAHTSLGGGNHKALQALLVACTGCASLELGHRDMDSECVSRIAKFLGTDVALTSFSLVGAPIDKNTKKELETSLVKNDTVKKLSFHSNGLRLPGFRSTKKINQSLSRLTVLDLSDNSLPVHGVKVLAKFLTKADTSLTTLILSQNNLTSKGASVLLPVVKQVTSLQKLDLSNNWLNDKVAPAVIDLLEGNTSLRTLDLSGNRSLKAHYGGYRRWWQRDVPPKRDGGKALIVKSALFDMTSLEAIANSNHTCAVRFNGQKGDINAELIHDINSINGPEGLKIRHKVVLAVADKNKDLFDPLRFSNLPLELMPKLLELVQQELGVNGFGKALGWKAGRKDRSTREWNRSTYSYDDIPDPTLNLVYSVIMAWESLPLLFVNGAGELPERKVVKQTLKKKSRKRRRRFGDEDDDDDEPYIPRGGRKRGRREYNSETRRFEYIPPPAEFA